jgi:two-component system response regulator AtoC
MTEENSKPMRLLLVDDEEDLVTFLAHRLTKRGLEVYTANCGKDAIKIATEKKIDVAVVDLKMPDMDGIKVMENIKRIQPYTEVLMLTGHGSHDSAWEAGRLCAFRYLLKPYNFEELYGLVLTAGENRRTRLYEEYEEKLEKLMTSTTSPRDLIEESDRLRSEYEQD